MISTSGTNSITDISGTYVSDRIDTNSTFRSKRILSITLRQENNSIKGQFIDSLDGPIYGTNDNGNIELNGKPESAVVAKEVCQSTQMGLHCKVF